MMVNAFATFRLDYCNSLHCGLPKREIDKLHVFRTVPRLVSGMRRSYHITSVMKDLHWLPLVHTSILKCCF